MGDGRPKIWYVYLTTLKQMSPFFVVKLYIFLVSSYRTAVDNAVLKLAESGKLVELKNRWWQATEAACVVSIISLPFLG